MSEHERVRLELIHNCLKQLLAMQTHIVNSREELLREIAPKLTVLREKLLKQARMGCTIAPEEICVAFFAEDAIRQQAWNEACTWKDLSQLVAEVLQRRLDLQSRGDQSRD